MHDEEDVSDSSDEGSDYHDEAESSDEEEKHRNIKNRNELEWDDSTF